MSFCCFWKSWRCGSKGTCINQFTSILETNWENTNKHLIPITDTHHLWQKQRLMGVCHEELRGGRRWWFHRWMMKLVIEGSRVESSRARSCIAKASSSDSGSGSGYNLAPVAPLKFESSVGQLLKQILQNHPHLLPTAIDQQFDNPQNVF
ncbi:putative UV-B-induced protein [Helianthus annuus]|nr:putative UV-B-induced protein [Helianthus annuus]